MPRRRPIPPTIKSVQGLSGTDALCTPTSSTFVDDFTGEVRTVQAPARYRRPIPHIVEPVPKAVQAQRVLEDAGLVAKAEPGLVVPKGKRIVATLQTSDGPRYILEPIKPMRRL